MNLWFLLIFLATVLTVYVIVADMESRNKNIYYIIILALATFIAISQILV